MTTDAATAPLDYHERWQQEVAGGRFVVPRCEACGLTFWHPRRHCPNCLSDRIGFVEPTWPAHVYTYTVNHRPKQAGQDAATAMVGYVELADGVRILANLELPDDIAAIGAAVRPEARPTDDGVRFVFVPAGD